LLNRTPNRYLEPTERGAIFVAELNQVIVGFGEAAPGAVVAIYVDPTVVRQGIGDLILNHALKLAATGHKGPIRVESTLNASAFYARDGFEFVARSAVRRNDVEVPIVVMERHAG